MSLDESIVKLYGEIDMKKIMVVSDLHAPFTDKKAVSILQQYQKEYRPDEFVINGDLIDFYSISKFDKIPERKTNVAEEIKAANFVLEEITKGLPKGCKKTYIEGNHEYRLQQFVWKNPEFYGLDAVDIKNLLYLKDRDIQLVRADGDYWKKQNQYKVADTLILHGDNRLDGAKTSQYSGYSAKNTLQTMMGNIVMGHVHRGATVYHKTPDKTLVGVEDGCLCQPTGTANWQQGFVTFEVDKGKGYNFRFHHIEKGKMYENGKIYKG